MTQFARPNSNITQLSFTGGFADIDETVASDTDFAASTDGTAPATLEVGLSAVTDPASSIGHIVRYRYSKSATGGQVVNLVVSLVQGSTVIASATHNALSSATFTDGTFTLTSSEANAITDYSDLRFRFDRTGDNGGSPSNRRGARVSWAVLEVPDAPATQQYFRTAADTVTSVSDSVAGTVTPDEPPPTGDGYADAVLALGPLGYWRLGESSGTLAADLGSVGKIGDYIGNFTLGQTGALAGDADTAVRFDTAGTAGRVQVDYDAGFNVGDGPLSIVAWVKFDAPGEYYDGIGYRDWFLHRKPSNHGTFPSRISFGGGSTVMASTSAVNDTNWHMVVVTYNGGTTGRIYIDGVEGTAQSGTNVLGGATDPAIQIGFDAGAGRSANGTVDEFAFFNKVLTPTEIAALYEAGTSDEEPPPFDGTFMTRPASTVVDISNDDDVLIENISINGGSLSAPSGVGIKLSNCHNITIRDVDMQNLVGGIYLYQCSGTLLLQNVRSRNIGDGTIGSGHSNHIQVAESVMSGYIKGCRFLGGRTEDMVSIFHSGGPDSSNKLIVELNHVQGLVADSATARAWTSASGTGIILGDGSGSANNGNIEVRQNTFLTPGQVGIQLIDGPNLLVHDNIIYGEKRAGNNNPITSWEGNPIGEVYNNTYYWINADDSLPEPWFAEYGTINSHDNTKDPTLNPADYVIDINALFSAGAQVMAAIADTVTTVTDSLLRSADFVRTLPDTLSTSDAIGRVANKTRSMADSITAVTDSIVRAAFGFARSMTDTTTASDTVGTRKTLKRLGADTVSSVSDVVARTANKVRSLGDTTSVTDAVARTANKVRAAGDTITTVSDALVRGTLSFSRTLTDTVITSDIVAGARFFGRLAVDTVTSITDSIARQANKIRTATQTLNTTDAIVRSANKVRSIADSITGVTDSVFRGTIIKVRTVLDTTTVAEGVSRASMSLHRTSVDTYASVSDAIVRGLAGVRSAIDTTTISDSVARLPQTLTRTISDSAGVISDTLSRAVSFGRTVVDAIVTAADSVAATVFISTSELVRGITDTVVTSDTIGRIVTFRRSLSDVLSISDGVTLLKGALRGVVDSITTSDSVARSLDAMRSATDVTIVTDAVSRAALALTRTTSDAITSVSDVIFRVSDKVRTARETLVVSDVVQRSWTGTRQIFDTLPAIVDQASSNALLLIIRGITDTVNTVEDSVGRVINVSRSLADAVITSDFVGKVILYARSAVDTIDNVSDFVVRSGVVVRRVVQDSIAIGLDIVAFVKAAPGYVGEFVRVIARDDKVNVGSTVRAFVRNHNNRVTVKDRDNKEIVRK